MFGDPGGGWPLRRLLDHLAQFTPATAEPRSRSLVPPGQEDRPYGRRTPEHDVIGPNSSSSSDGSTPLGVLPLSRPHGRPPGGSPPRGSVGGRSRTSRSLSR